MPYREPARKTTRYLRLCLDVLTNPTRCTADWEAMEHVSDACRICHRCSARVTDVREMDAREAETFLGEHISEKRPPRLTLLRRRDGRLIESECPAGRERTRQRHVMSAVGLLFAVAMIVSVVR